MKDMTPDVDRTVVKGDINDMLIRLLGRIVAVKYNARIADKRSQVDSLFLPVFIEFRDDKDVADSSKAIK